MITKDEELHLAGCLASVRDIADEIVVVDTGSEDDTVAISKRFGAKASRFEWCDDFAAARNASIDRATGDWLLHLDADEALDPVNAAAIRALVDADGARADAVEVTLANYCDDPRAWRWVPAPAGNAFARGYSGYVKTMLLRLFRNGKGYRYREPVHENITASVMELGGRIAASELLIHHYGYDPSPEVRARKAAQYLAIARRKAATQPDNAKALLDLAEQAFACGDTPEAEAASRAALKLEPQHMGAGTMLANILLNRGELDAARAVIAALPRAAHLHTAMAAVHLAQGRPEDALVEAEQALLMQPESPMARLYLSRALDQLGRAQEAGAELLRARASFPGLKEVVARVTSHELRGEGERALTDKDAAGALKKFTAALKLDPEDPLIYCGVGKALKALGHEAAEQNFRRALQLAPGLEAARAGLANA